MDFMTVYQSIWTVVVFVIFVGIVIWAWSSKNKAAFDQASRIPLDDDNDQKKSELRTEQQESNNG